MSRPNILFLMTDQQRGDCLGIAGHPCLLTPNMDALAADGVRFRRAYSTCPVCIPARRSLLSGLHPQSHGMVGYDSSREWGSAPTLPLLLRDAGYQTGLVGRSMHQFPPGKRLGYEEIALSSGNDSLSEYNRDINRHLPDGGGYYGSGVMHNDWTARTWHLPEPMHQTHWTVNQALRFLERRDPTRPWFLTVSFLAPHPPLVPPDFYFQRYLRTLLPERWIGDWAEPPEPRGGAPKVDAAHVDLTGETLRSCRAAYFALINQIDDQIRRLLSSVTGFDQKNTLVVFTSDHGEMLGDHYFYRKSLPYEGASRIPFLIRPPGSWEKAARGDICDLPVCLEDLMPTLLESAEVEPPEGLDGLSLLPALRGEIPPSWREDLHIEYAPGPRAFHCLTDGQEKYIWFSQSGKEQFFDLERDPRELHDLSGAGTAAGRIREWRNRLIQRLANRPEGFVSDNSLKPGCAHNKKIPGSGG